RDLRFRAFPCSSVASRLPAPPDSRLPATGHRFGVFKFGHPLALPLDFRSSSALDLRTVAHADLPRPCQTCPGRGGGSPRPDGNGHAKPVWAAAAVRLESGVSLADDQAGAPA